MNKPYFSRNFFLIDWCHKRLKNAIDLLLFYGEHFYELLESDLKQDHFKTGDLWKKRENGGCPLKMGASRSKRESWNIWTNKLWTNKLCSNSRPEVFCNKDVLRSFTKFTGKQLCQSLFFNKVAGIRPVTLSKKRLWQRCFSMNFVKFLRTPFFMNTSGCCFWLW